MDFGTFLRRLGENVRRARWAAGLTQQQLAEKTGSYRYLQEIERGVRNPSVETLYVIAQALNVTPAVLIDVDPEKTRRARERLKASPGEPPRAGRKPKKKRA